MHCEDPNGGYQLLEYGEPTSLDVLSSLKRYPLYFSALNQFLAGMLYSLYVVLGKSLKKTPWI